MARSTFQSGAASNPGTRGVATGVAGGRGGQRGGFSARPNPPYDSVMLARRYQGSGKARITVANGKILSVSIVQSSGISYLDSKAAAWIRSRWKPAPGTEGTFTVPFIFRLAR
jgi:TonB family protein